MKELKLKVASRILVINLLNEAGKGGGTLQQLKDMMKIIEKVEVTEEEKKALEYKFDAEAGRVSWKPENDEEKSIELNDEQATILKDILKKKNDAKEFTFDVLLPLGDVADQLDVK